MSPQPRNQQHPDRRSSGLAGASSLSLLGWQQVDGHGEALLALENFVFYIWVCKGSQSVCEQKSKETEHVHVDRAEEKGWVGRGVFGKRAHNHGYVLVHMWVCRRKERSACGLEVMGKFCSFDFDSFSEDAHGFLCRSQRSCTIPFPGLHFEKSFPVSFCGIFLLTVVFTDMRGGGSRVNRPPKFTITLCSNIHECHHW